MVTPKPRRRVMAPPGLRFTAALLPIFFAACAVFGGAGEDAAPYGAARAGDGLLRPLGDISTMAPYVETGAGAREQVPARLFVSPVSVSARFGKVYIADSGTESVYRYDRYRQSVRKLAGFPSYLDSDIFVRADGAFYLSDPFNRKVFLFDHEGRLVRSYRDDIYLMFPSSIAVNEKNGDVYAADGMRDDIIVFNGVGQLVRIIGSPEGAEGRIFGRIEDMALWDDKLYVADAQAREIHVMSLDGKHMYSFGRKDLSKPKAIAAGAGGRVFVADTGTNSIKVFHDGELVEDYGGRSPGGRMFSQISGIAADDGLLYVADALAGKVFIFMASPGGAKAPPASQ